MRIGLMKTGKVKYYSKPRLLNTVTCKDVGYKQYRWLWFYWTVPLERTDNEG
jgi:hypothetical protein